MFCAKCGKQVEPEAKFCISCGAKILIAGQSSSQKNNAPPLLIGSTPKRGAVGDAIAGFLDVVEDAEREKASKGGRVRPWWADLILAMLALVGVIMWLADKFK